MTKHARQGWFLLFIAMLLPLTAFAEDKNYFTPSDTDISIQYLRQVFGTVGNVLIGSSNQILGRIFAIFNTGIMIFVGYFISYTVATSVLKSADQGSGMGQGGGATNMVIMRVVSGVTLLVPQFKGYSLIQIGVMYTVIHGVGLADSIWEEAIKYVEASGSVYMPSESTMPPAGTAVDPYAAQATFFQTGLQEIIEASACLVKKMQVLESQRATQDVTLQSKDGKLFAKGKYNFRLRFDKACSYDNTELANGQHRACLGGLTSENVEKWNKSGVKIPTENELGDFNAQISSCGQFTWNTASFRFSPAGEALYHEAAKTLINDIYQSVAMVYKQAKSKFGPGATCDAACQAYLNCAKGTGYCPIFSRDMAAAVTRYYSLMKVVQHTQTPETSETSDASSALPASSSSAVSTTPVAAAASTSATAEDPLKNAKELGWLMAGSYYRSLVGKDQKTDADKMAPPTSAQLLSYKPIRSQPSGPICGTKDQESGLSQICLRISQSSLLANANQLNNPFNSGYAVFESLRKSLKVSTFSDQIQPATTVTALDEAAYNFVKAYGLKSPGMGIHLKSDIALKGLSKIKLDDIPIAIEKMMNEFLTGFSGMSLGQKSCSDGKDECEKNKTKNCFQTLVTQGCVINGKGLFGAILADQKGLRFSPLTNMVNAGLTAMNASSDFFRNSLSNLFNKIYDLMTFYTSTIIATSAAAGAASGALSMLPFGIIAGEAVSAAAQAAVSIFKIWYQIDQFKLTVYLPLGSALATLIFGIGVLMGVYVPFIPALLFIFSGIGWMISVIEAMVAGPLVALGITHPEGHDLLGKAEQSLMLLFSVFLRPVCIIVSFLVALMLMFIATKMLNFNFVYMLKDILSAVISYADGGADGAQMARYIVTIGVVFIYVYLLMAVINQCFSVIYVIPDKIMRWIGGPAEQSQIERMVSEVKGSTTQAGQQISSGAGDSLSKASSVNLSAGEISTKAWKMGGDKEKSESGTAT